ncbi:MAG: winged helix DNA-binding protein [Firmicutes bacterium]|nr:winged helix DNA-binding protein [Bacillota bacterium]MBQ3123470.1 winged helix DNA-binding protein [Bacillota bacterium]MBQ9972541.1 winged helix DNA-binding protein [Bacillota bacterium]
MRDIYYEQLLEYNKTYKDVDELYTNYAKMCGLSESDFWILYALAEAGSVRTQKDLCEWWSISKQTINSALKSLEKEGVVTLSSTEENKKTKYITLTEKGIEMVEKFIKPLMIAELAAFEMMGKEETREYLRLNKIYAETLNLTISKLGLDD